MSVCVRADKSRDNRDQPKESDTWKRKKFVKTDKKWHAKATITNKQTKCTKVLDNESNNKKKN